MSRLYVLFYQIEVLPLLEGQLICFVDYLADLHDRGRELLNHLRLLLGVSQLQFVVVVVNLLLRTDHHLNGVTILGVQHLGVVLDKFLDKVLIPFDLLPGLPLQVLNFRCGYRIQVRRLYLANDRIQSPNLALEELFVLIYLLLDPLVVIGHFREGIVLVLDLFDDAIGLLYLLVRLCHSRD